MYSDEAIAAMLADEMSAFQCAPSPCICVTVDEAAAVCNANHCRLHARMRSQESDPGEVQDARPAAASPPHDGRGEAMAGVGRLMLGCGPDQLFMLATMW